MKAAAAGVAIMLPTVAARVLRTKPGDRVARRVGEGDPDDEAGQRER